MTLKEALSELPFIAVLRGITPKEIESVGEVLWEMGFRCLEVTLNSPKPLESIAKLADAFGQSALIGAGTVTKESEVQQVMDHGGRLIVTPHCDAKIIQLSCQQGLEICPGCFTPSEAFQAIKAGATTLKLFPISTGGAPHLKALRAVLPSSITIAAVGGVSPQGLDSLYRAGAKGFGLGNALYHAGKSLAAIQDSARQFVRAWEAISESNE